MTDRYPIIVTAGAGEFRDRGSKFLGFAHPVRDEKAALAIVEQYKKLHHKARHWCYAYRIGADKNRFRANDDGEPSGTAGRPILGQIDKLGVSDVVVVVVRYFGGVKLGTSGLIVAYREGAALALAEAIQGERLLTHRLKIAFTYAKMGDVMNAINGLDLAQLNQDFNASPSLEVEVPQSKVAETIRQLKARIGGVYLAEVDDEFTLEDVSITLV